MCSNCGWASCHFRFRSVVDHAMPCYSMKMEVPGLADSLQQCLCVNSGIYAGNVLDTDPGWQQSKLIWALSAEVGSAPRMHCTGLWHVKAAQQPFRFFVHRPIASSVFVCVCFCTCGCPWMSLGVCESVPCFCMRVWVAVCVVVACVCECVEMRERVWVRV